jgi:hypothetical protein
VRASDATDGSEETAEKIVHIIRQVLIKPVQDESRGLLYPYSERSKTLHPGLGDE